MKKYGLIMKRKFEKAYLTIEATLIFPFLILTTVLAIFMVVYVYDKALLVQDVNTLCIMGMEANRNGEGNVKDILTDKFNEIVEEHPYLSVENMNMSVDVEGTKALVSINYDYIVPVLSAFNRNVSFTNDFSYVTPVYIMKVMEDAEGGGPEK